MPTAPVRLVRTWVAASARVRFGSGVEVDEFGDVGGEVVGGGPAETDSDDDGGQFGAGGPARLGRVVARWS